MNMNGGYDVQEYEALMDKYIRAQVIPFVENFLVTIDEYRENYYSKDAANKARARFVCNALNKFTDDDCGGAELGTLLLEDTKYEMGDAAYNALSTAEKNKHCDIVTLFAQADGQVLLSIYALLTRAADTSDDSWIDRFLGLTYDDILDSYDLAYTDAAKQAARDYQDDAKTLLESWEEYRTFLLNADDNYAALEALEMPDTDAVESKINALDKNSTKEEVKLAAVELVEAELLTEVSIDLLASVAAAEYLESIEYEDGTLYDFFTRPTAEVANDLESLYPMIAALSPGQRAGLEFLSINEFVSVSNREIKYSIDDLKDVPVASVFEGVDRAIYEKGGVAMTWDAKRESTASTDVNLAERSKLSTKTIVCYAVTGATFLGMLGAAAGWGFRTHQINEAKQISGKIMESFERMGMGDSIRDRLLQNHPDLPLEEIDKMAAAETERVLNGMSGAAVRYRMNYGEAQNIIKRLSASTTAAKWLAVGFAAVTFIMAVYSAYSTWQDLKDFYKVDFTPIPHYMVDMVSITYEENGETFVRENHAAYYAAVKCNRTEDDGFGGKRYEMMGDCADLNGDVGQQWLALYACKNYKEMQPILADSFKVVVGSTDLPATYDGRGIHMFGSSAAFNLNNKFYDWNQSAKSVFVYFKVDTSVTPEASTSGSLFGAGWVALIGVGCAGLGAAVTALAMKASAKKKKSEAKA